MRKQLISAENLQRAKKSLITLLIISFLSTVTYSQAPSIQLMSQISVTPNPIPSGSYVTITASVKNNGATGTFDFECDLLSSSNNFLTVIKKLCGITIAAGATQTITFQPASPGGYVNYPPGNYKIHLIALYSSCFQCGNSGCPVSSPSGFTNPVSITVVSPYCGGTTNLTSCSGSFNDGSGSNTYCNNADCSWLIQPAGATSITLNFSAFAVENNFDHVRVYNGTNASAPLLGSFTGNSPPPTITSGSAMFIRFTSDNATVAQGWSASYSCSSGCTPVSISSQPSAQTVAVGQNANFSVTCSGTTPFTYQWQVSTNGGSSYTTLTNGGNTTWTTSGSTSTLTISNATAGMNNNRYRCIVSNNCPSSSTSSGAILTVSTSCQAINITTQPSGQTVIVGQNVSFSVSGSGTTPFTYQWQVSTNGGSSYTALTNGGNTTWTTSGSNSTLTASNVTAGMNNNRYRCVVSNTCPSSMTSSAAILTVTTSCQSVSISSQPSAQTVAVGQNTSFNVTGSGSAPFSYQWQVSTNGGSSYTALTNGGNTTWTTSGSSSTLTVSNVIAGMNNNRYRCVVSNSCPSSMTSNAAILTVSGTINTITGFTRNVRVNVPTRTIDLPAYPGCIVNAYIAGTSTLAGSDVSDNNGFFQINLSSTGNYDIKATDNASPSNSVKVFGIAANSSAGDIKIPAALLQQIMDEKNNLINLYPTLSSLGTTTALSFSYNVSGQNSLLSQWKNITANYNPIVESAGRLFIADSVLHMFYQNADKLNDEMAKSTYELMKAFLSITTFLNKASAALQVSNNIIVREAVEALLNLFFNWVSNKIDQWVAALPPERYLLKVSIKAGLDRLRHEHTPTSGLYFQVLQPIVENIFASVTIGREYIQLTQPSFNYATTKAATFGYTGSFNTHFNQAMQQSLQAWQDAELAKIQSTYHRDLSKIISVASDWVTATAGVTTLTPLAGIAAVLRILSFAGNVWAAGELAISTTKSIRGFYSNIEKLQPAVQSAYRSGFSSQSRTASLAIIDSIVNIYNARLTSFRSTIAAGNYTLAKLKLDSITRTEAALQEIVKEAMIPVTASDYFANTLIPEYDSILLNKLRITMNLQPKASFRFQMCGLSLLIDTTQGVTKDSLLLFVDYLKQTNLGIRAEFDSVYGMINQVPSYNYIQSISSNIPFAMEKGRSAPVKIKFKNYSSFACSTMYAKIWFDGPFAASTDSVYFGNFAAGKVDSLSFTLTAPTVDTVTSFYISFFSPNTISEGFAGIVRARDLPAAPVLSYETRVCFGDTLKLFANSDEFGARYYWTGPGGFVSQFKNPTIPNVGLANIGTYTCYVSSDKLNSQVSSVNVSITKPQVAITGNLNFCQNSSTTLIANGALNYRWNTGINTAVIVISNPGNYTVIGENANGCKDTAVARVTMMPAPVINLNSSTIIYQGGRIILGGHPVATGVFPLKYKWTPSTGLNYDTVTNPIATPAANIRYTLLVTDRNGCYSTKSTDIFVYGFSVNPNPAIDIVNIYGFGLVDGNYVISVTNVIGQEVSKKEVNVLGGSMTEQIYIGNLPPQLYLLSIKNGGMINKGFKIIKN